MKTTAHMHQGTFNHSHGTDYASRFVDGGQEVIPVVRPDESISGLRRYGVSHLSVFAYGPWSTPSVALIPEAIVIDGCAKPEPDHKLAIGDTIYVPGFGAFRIDEGTSRNGGNEDWPKLVPVDGPRFYVEHEGGTGWAIRDAQEGGQRVHYEVVQDTCERLFGKRGADSAMEALAIATFLSATTEA
jgi:hypothetical protein